MTEEVGGVWPCPEGSSLRKASLLREPRRLGALVLRAPCLHWALLTAELILPRMPGPQEDTLSWSAQANLRAVNKRSGLCMIPAAFVRACAEPTARREGRVPVPLRESYESLPLDVLSTSIGRLPVPAAQGRSSCPTAIYCASSAKIGKSPTAATGGLSALRSLPT